MFLRIHTQQVGLIDDKQIDAVYGDGEPTHHLYFEFLWGAEGTHQFGHYSVLVPSANANKHKLASNELQLADSVSWLS